VAICGNAGSLLRAPGFHCLSVWPTSKWSRMKANPRV
jgi:hypothetical protein